MPVAVEEIAGVAEDDLETTGYSGILARGKTDTVPEFGHQLRFQAPVVLGVPSATAIHDLCEGVGGGLGL